MSIYLIFDILFLSYEFTLSFIDNLFKREFVYMYTFPICMGTLNQIPGKIYFILVKNKKII